MFLLYASPIEVTGVFRTMSFCQGKKVYKQYSNLYIVREIFFSIIHKYENILGNLKRNVMKS